MITLNIITIYSFVQTVLGQRQIILKFWGKYQSGINHGLLYKL
jgi:hypothetical protein